MKEVKNQVRAVPTLKIPKMAKAKLDLSVSEMDRKVKRLGPPSNGEPNQKCFQVDSIFEPSEPERKRPIRPESLYHSFIFICLHFLTDSEILFLYSFHPSV